MGGGMGSKTTVPILVESRSRRNAYFHVPRPPCLDLPGIPHHITQRGNYRQKTYFRAEDYQFYLDLINE